MTRQVRHLTVTVVVEIDADDADALPEVEGFTAPLTDDQAPIAGIKDLSNRVTDSCIFTAFQMLERAGVKAMLQDAHCTVSDSKDEEHPDDWFY
jgi:hypothetical protein